MNIVLIGPQGSGKGTQAQLLSQLLSLPALSVGQLYRRQIKEQTQTGQQAKKYVLAGKLVPDKITERLLKQELKNKKYNQGVIFDGFPRNYKQNKFLEKILPIDAVILIEISRQEILKRLSGRYVCDCGEIFNFYSNKIEQNLACKKCGGQLKQRVDDRPGAIKQRLKIYGQETVPLFKYYRSQKKLITISGEQSVVQVFKAITQALKRKGLIK